MSSIPSVVSFVPIDTIRIEPRFQVRERGADRKRVKALVDVYRDDPAAMPPLVVVARIGVDVGAGLTLLDGHARLAALRELGATEAPIVLDATPASASDDERIERAWTLNVGHGFPPTLADRKAHVRWRRTQFPAERLSETARRCGLNRDTVALLAKTPAENPQDVRDPQVRASGPDAQVDRVLDALTNSDALTREIDVVAHADRIAASFEDADDLREYAASLRTASTNALSIAAELERFE